MSDTVPAVRDENGRFIKGNKASPGRATAAKEKKYLATMVNVVSVKDWESITLMAVEQALEGDYRARDWLTKYLVGPPPVGLSAEMREETDPITGDKIKRLAVMVRSIVSAMELE